MSKKQPRYILDGVQDGHYVRAFKERREIVVQVWLNKTRPEGEPDGDWCMPGVLGITAAVGQAVLQTKGDKK